MKFKIWMVLSFAALSACGSSVDANEGSNVNAAVKPGPGRYALFAKKKAESNYRLIQRYPISASCQDAARAWHKNGHDAYCSEGSI